MLLYIMVSKLTPLLLSIFMTFAVSKFSSFFNISAFTTEANKDLVDAEG